MGGGLSVMSPTYGLGVDNVINLEVVLADGRHVNVDECSHPDLFWALRGGGGGTFGVVTSVHYALQTLQPVTFAMVNITHNFLVDQDYSMYMRTVDLWIDFWVDKSPRLDRRWGGYWSLSGFPYGETCVQD